MKYFILLFLFLSPAFSRASYSFSPVGSQEAFLGNAGVGLLCSAGSPLYNPAGLGFCEYELNLTVSGTGIAYQEMQDPAFHNQTGSFTSSTLMTSAVFSVDEKIKTGFFYSYPANVDNTFRIQDASGGVTAKDVRFQFAQGGLSYGGLIDESLAWGFSIAFTWNELTSDSITNTVSAGTTTSLNQKRFEQQNYIALNPGFVWRARDDYSIGATVQWRALNLYSEGDLYQNQLSTGDTLATETFGRYTPHTDPILGVTVGQVFHFNDKTFLLDLSYAPQYALPSTPIQQESDLSLFNISTGIKIPFRSVRFMGGGSFTQMSNQSISMFSTGINYNNRTYEANFGLYYKYSKNDEVGASNSDTLGFMYSSSVNY
ncbi:hypothetical protein [Bdellovibrio sp. KM01]|uniref:hypothetical protein n=1 Tax=Bdellovibrio sp. KM01 TaxID=2748865 RepID=UPI0015E8FC8D|nr:hypothetical protein [Bdellovibrio sp. KM01]QLY26734.1 hypothetical protein HW988_06930 [Bdellovibrio sp. KM01]